MPYNEAPYSANFKPDTGYDSPMITVRAESAEELEGKLNQLANGGAFDAVGRAQAALVAKYNLGKVAGATTENHMQPTTPPPAFAQEAVQQAQQQQYGQPAAGGWQQPGVPQPQAVQQPQAAAVPQQGYGQPQQPVAQQASIPGAPLVLGVPARMVTGNGAKGAWRAWADPRPKEQTQHLGQNDNTDNPNDPGLANGTKKFWAWIR